MATTIHDMLNLAKRQWEQSGMKDVEITGSKPHPDGGTLVMAKGTRYDEPVQEVHLFLWA